MYRSDSVDGLQFHDYQVFNEEVDAIAEIKFHTPINHWEADLSQRLEPSAI